MTNQFADRIRDVPRSFIREILKVALDPSVISFAGGLPNRDYFPIEKLQEATNTAFTRYGTDLLQYGNSEGFPPLREYIRGYYKRRHGIEIGLENILVTSGSQQGLDLIGKILINDDDAIVIEEPGYLGAIQAFSIYRPEFYAVPVSDDGMEPADLEMALDRANAAGKKPKLMYTVPNFQNPSGISYSEENRDSIAAMLSGRSTWLVEDDPYGEIRFAGEAKPSFLRLMRDRTIALGSFSKTVVPGFRLGWIIAPEELMQKLIIAKQATDLHTTHFTQAIVYEFLTGFDIDEHIARIRSVYGNQCRAMQESIRRHLPATISHTKPEGGMFLWATLPERLAAVDLFEIAAKDRVVFVPGDPFYIGKTRLNTMRLNFSCVDESTIDEGMRRIGKAIETLDNRSTEM